MVIPGGDNALIAGLEGVHKNRTIAAMYIITI
jgi:hypothetical protein